MTTEVYVSVWNRGLRLALLAPAVGVAAAVLLAGQPGAAGAATTPVTPESLTNCVGGLTADPTGPSQDEPNLVDYAFSCDTPITAYTVTVDRLASGQGNLDNYSPTAGVFLNNQTTPSTTEGFTCEGSTPSNGINCNAGAASQMDAYDFAEGSVDLVEPYCAYLPAKAKAGTPAVPQAIVSVVVTDNTGAEDGPFYLSLNTKCAKVPAVVPAAPTTSKKKSKKKH